MKQLNNCKFVIEENKSKNDKLYRALYIVINDEKILLTFLTKKQFDNLNK